MKIKKGFVVRIVGGESIAVPVGELSKNFHGMITLNETAKFLWDFFQEDHTPDEAIAALFAEYEVEEEIAKNDVKTFVDLLSKNGFIG
ncbi:MAG: PqqD family protein [Clostridia bacterium]|nr:PqqD family protein [Clostridia bacterium]